jgi:hypothetical protein
MSQCTPNITIVQKKRKRKKTNVKKRNTKMKNSNKNICNGEQRPTVKVIIKSSITIILICNSIFYFLQNLKDKWIKLWTHINGYIIYKYIIRDINNVKCSRETELYRNINFSMWLSQVAVNSKGIFAIIEILYVIHMVTRKENTS